MSALTYLHGAAVAQGLMRCEVDDFYVEEVLGFEPSGEGEHVFLWIEKRGTNTQFVAEQLSKLAKVHPRDVSFAGQKDRHARTLQWFSVRLAGQAEPHWCSLNDETIQVLRTERHHKKLRRGTLQGNRFRITLKSVTGIEHVATRFQRICEQGVPNYFGEQRFGHQGKNIDKARSMFAGQRIKNKNQKSMYLSAARSYLYNQVVSQRIAQYGVQCLVGDVVVLQGSHSFFLVDSWSDTLKQRLDERDIHISAPLWGEGQLATQQDALTLEQGVAEQHEWITEGLSRAGLKQERRAMLLYPEAPELLVDTEQQSVTVAFTLSAGCFATSVLRELIDYKDMQQIT
tara:strand:- start:2056 stop:3084 length:1029 start_codon:yes stop_codon:yes gene_type:complete